MAQYAAAIAMQWYRTDVHVEIKGDGSPVTIADREAERQADREGHPTADGPADEEAHTEAAAARRVPQGRRLSNDCQFRTTFTG